MNQGLITDLQRGDANLQIVTQTLTYYHPSVYALPSQCNDINCAECRVWLDVITLGYESVHTRVIVCTSLVDTLKIGVTSSDIGNESLV